MCDRAHHDNIIHHASVHGGYRHCFRTSNGDHDGDDKLANFTCHVQKKASPTKMDLSELMSQLLRLNTSFNLSADRLRIRKKSW